MESWEIEARERCRDTLARYTHAGDRFLMDTYVATFADDGVLEIRGEEPLEGRAAILARFSAPMSDRGEGAGTAGPRIVRHNISNVLFEELSPSEAVVGSYFTVFTDIGLDHMGRYRDRLIPVGDRWLLAHRFVSVDWLAPDSHFGGQLAEKRR